MILNYIKLSFRLMARNPFFTFINVAGLSVGFATFLLLWPYAEHELKSDQYHQHADRIARLAIDFKWTDNDNNWDGFLGAFNSWGVAHEISKTFPRVEEVTRISIPNSFDKKLQGIDKDLFITIIKNTDEKIHYREPQSIFADPNFFQFFTIPLISGDKQHVLDAPNTVVLSEATAKKYFGGDRAIGKIVYLNDSIPVMVTGVYENLPSNTQFQFDLAFSVVGKQGIDISTWGGWTGYCYFRLEKGYDFSVFQQDLDKRKSELYAFVKYGCAHCDWSPLVQPLTEVVFTDYRGNIFKTKSKYLLEGLYVVSFIVLLLGWINYITLSIHSLNKRLKELATRKVVGAAKKEFSQQFFVESVVINFIAGLAALTLFQLLKNPAEQWLNLYTPAWSDHSNHVLMVIVSMFVAGVVLTAAYPLWIIQKKGIHELFKKSNTRLKPSILNSGLVTVQYGAAVMLLIWVFIISAQLNYVLEKDIGIKKEGVVVIEGPASATFSDSRISSFLQEIKRIEGIRESTVSYSLAGDPDAKGITLQRNKSSNFVGVDSNGGVDENFLKTFEIELVAGRNFLADNPADRNSLLISRALMKRLAFQSPEEAIGQRVLVPQGTTESAEIIGIISDYEFRPFYNDATEHGRGVALFYKDFLVPFYKPLKLSFSLDVNQSQEILDRVEALYQSLFPQETFKWYWLDEKVGRQYNNEKVAKNQIAFFTILAIGIACLGLLGLINSKAIEKTKEIGIRKVLGAELHQITQVLLNPTVKQMVIAALVGVPVAWRLSVSYLEKFSERTELQWWYFTLPVLILVVIMLLTISSVVWKAARSNPVEALKYE
ncbi:MAG TPA: ABC transporter permease [Cyclobacteriaceae bacterium]|nr:ABC transporter permease [Cyclobacteriaceae bacterium]HRJ80729.1 ABC transporter permease [Cyclobacteriaceae bacterium]